MIIPFRNPDTPQRELIIDGVGTLFPVFMPIVPLPWTMDTEVIYEVLARVTSMDGFTLLPGEFLGDKVPALTIDQSILRLIPWIQDGAQGIRMSFNCAPSSLCNNDYFDALQSMVLAREIDPALLVLEITEDSLGGLFDVEMMDRVESLRSYGMRIALDDFGSGGNGISRLASGHFDMLKISPGLDVSSPRGKIIVEGMIAMISSLSGASEGHMALVIEGIETQQQLKSANFIGATYGQGALIGQAVEGIVTPSMLIDKVALAVSESLSYC